MSDTKREFYVRAELADVPPLSPEAPCEYLVTAETLFSAIDLVESQHYEGAVKAITARPIDLQRLVEKTE